MTEMNVKSFIAGHWIEPGAGARDIFSAVNGEHIGRAGNDTIDLEAMLRFAKDTGGPALRELTFHDRARRLKKLALLIGEHKQSLYELAFQSGATKSDSMIDVDGGIGTALVFASKARRELPDDKILLDGDVEQLSRDGSFVGQHIYTSRPGVAIHINAFNFPVWGMLEKLSPALLAGMPAIVKPATVTSYISEACFRLMVDSEIFPPGSFQLLAANTGTLLNQLDCQDMVSFTGSAQTALSLRANQNLQRNAVPFIAEQDSLNASLLGPDVDPDSPEFDVFVKEISREMTSKAGQKCTAIRRVLVTEAIVEPIINAVSKRLKNTRIGDPALEQTRMGALVSQQQKQDVLAKAASIGREAELVFGSPDARVDGIDNDKSSFVSPMLFHCKDPDAASTVHNTEAFGPVATIMTYRDHEHASQLLNRGGGSLVASVFTRDTGFARDMCLASAAFHGRLYFNNRDSMKQATGHGAPMPHMVHGGPGRAGGGEELGGSRGVKHYMQRTALQGSPDLITGIGNQFVPGATVASSETHPFRKRFDELAIGDTLETASRSISIEDIEKFAELTGDNFYAHMDEQAAAANPFFPGRVAHGYLLLSYAAGLFVDPDPGPVLANTGLTGLSFQKPVVAGDAIRVSLTVKRKTRRNDEYGEVRWHVRLDNQDDEQVASYELHTMNSY